MTLIDQAIRRKLNPLSPDQEDETALVPPVPEDPIAKAVSGPMVDILHPEDPYPQSVRPYPLAMPQMSTDYNAVRGEIEKALGKEPEYQEIPSEPTGFKAGLRRAAIGRIPMIGREMLEAEDYNRAIEKANIVNQYNARKAAWQKQADIIKPIFERDFEFNQMFQQYKVKLDYFLSNKEYTWMTPAEAHAWAMGGQPTHDTTPYLAQVQGRERVGQLNNGIFTVKRLDGSEEKYDARDITNIAKVPTKPEPNVPQRDLKWEADRRKYWAFYLADHPEYAAMIPPGYEPNDADVAQAEMYWNEKNRKETQETGTWTQIQSEDGTVKMVNTKTMKVKPLLDIDGMPMRKYEKPPPEAINQARAAFKAILQAKTALRLVKENPTLVGPIQGRIEGTGLRVGNIPGLTGEQKEIAARLAAHLNYLFANELKAMFPGRTNQNIQRMIESTSGRIFQNPDIIKGALEATVFNAKMNLQDPVLMNYPPIKSMMDMAGLDYTKLTDAQLYELANDWDDEDAYKMLLTRRKK
jgi:hypothetical protein